MTWRPDGPQGNEIAKVRFEIVPYVRGRAVDLGCGPWKAFDHMIGIDALPTGVHGSPNLICDARRLPFLADGSMDCVLASHLLEDYAEKAPVLAEWVRLLRPGGYLILYLPHPDHYPASGTPGANPAHAPLIGPDDLAGIMADVCPDWDLVENQVRTQGDEYSYLQVYRIGQPGTGHVRTCDQPKPEKTAGVMRPGGYGDCLWASSVVRQLKREGYHVTVFTESRGEEILRHDPNVDVLVTLDDSTCPGTELLPFCIWQSVKFDRWVNLVGVVEGRLLPTQQDVAFYWPKEIRHREMDLNYLDEYHRFSGTEGAERRTQYYPTDQELEWARGIRAELGDRRLVLIQPSGSSAPKFWPHSGELMAKLAEAGIASVLIGDLRGRTYDAPEGISRIYGATLPIRQAMALCLVADVVVGVESVGVNVAAFESPLKVVILGHSSIDNLTRSWPNTVAIEPAGLDCYPCHRIHHTPHWCRPGPRDLNTSACHAAPSADLILGVVRDYLARLEGQGDALVAQVAESMAGKPAGSMTTGDGRPRKVRPTFFPPGTDLDRERRRIAAGG